MIRVRFDKRPRYIFHLVLILLAMFIAYPVGNFILKFQEGTQMIQYIKMFAFFLVILYLADNTAESIVKV